MTQVFDLETGVVTPVSVIEAGPCPVVAVRTPDADGYEAVQLAYESVADRKISKAERGHLGANGPATLTDGEPEAFLHGDGLDQLDVDGRVVPGHDHLGALGELDRPGHVRGPEVELGAVVVEERRVPASLLLGEHVDLPVEHRVRGDGAWP